MEIRRMMHLQDSIVPEAGTRLTGQTVKQMDIRKKGLLLALGRKQSMQGMRIVQRWPNCFKELGDDFLAGTF